MKKYRIIFHIDLNAFYASCEEAHDPSLKNQPIGIGGKTDRGILTTANYAARKYGVKSAMSVKEAKMLCPKLKVLPANFELYKHYSNLFFEYLNTWTDLIEPASIDEGYLDMTEVIKDKHPVKVAEEMRDYLLNHYDLPVSIGIAPNMFLAKMASDMKKPLGITVLRKDDVKEKLWPLPIEEMHGIGKKTVPNLKLLGIETIEDLATYKNREKLSKFLGNSTESFIQKANGVHERLVDPTRSETIQSIGNSKTYEGYLHEYQEMIQALDRLTKKVVGRLKDRSLAAKTITVQMRTSDYKNTSKNFSFSYHTNDYYEIFTEVERLFDDLFTEGSVHLLGVSSSNLKQSEDLFRQLNIFDVKQGSKKDEHISSVLSEINKHYKKPLLKRGLNDND